MIVPLSLNDMTSVNLYMSSIATNPWCSDTNILIKKIKTNQNIQQ